MRSDADRESPDDQIEAARSKSRVAREMPDRTSIAVPRQRPGIAEPEIGAVLEPFYRVERSRNHDTGGAGLGLAIAHRLSTALGGELRLTNRPGYGLGARLRLPGENYGIRSAGDDV